MPGASIGAARTLSLRGGVPGTTSAGVSRLPGTDRKVVLVHVDRSQRRGALASSDSDTITNAAGHALAQRVPLVVVLASSGADIVEGVASLDGWGRAARALADCSGIVPVFVIAYGLAVSGPALLLGMADVVVMTPEAVAYVSGPAAVAQLTGLHLAADRTGRPKGPRPFQRGGRLPGGRRRGRPRGGGRRPRVPARPRRRGTAGLAKRRPGSPARRPSCATSCRPAPPAPTTSATPSPPSPTTASCSRCGRAGRPSSSRPCAGSTADPSGWSPTSPRPWPGPWTSPPPRREPASSTFCDAFNVPLLTLVDTPGFMPGKDLEWRGMIRHGAQLVFAYAEATVPRVCLIMRKAFGGAYIVMDSKLMGNDLCLAWPSAQVAVMGAQGAVQILHRREDAATQARLADEYEETYLNPYVAAARGYVDQVIDPADTRASVAAAFRMLSSKRERIVPTEARQRPPVTPTRRQPQAAWSGQRVVSGFGGGRPRRGPCRTARRCRRFRRSNAARRRPRPPVRHRSRPGAGCRRGQRR